MSHLQDMLRVQAKLHRKQGANALGDLFESANKEIQLLRRNYEQLLDTLQDCQRDLKSAADREKQLKATVSDLELVCAINGDKQWQEKLNKFARDNQYIGGKELLESIAGKYPASEISSRVCLVLAHNLENLRGEHKHDVMIDGMADENAASKT